MMNDPVSGEAESPCSLAFFFASFLAIESYKLLSNPSYYHRRLANILDVTRNNSP